MVEDAAHKLLHVFVDPMVLTSDVDMVIHHLEQELGVVKRHAVAKRPEESDARALKVAVRRRLRVVIVVAEEIIMERLDLRPVLVEDAEQVIVAHIDLAGDVGAEVGHDLHRIHVGEPQHARIKQRAQIGIRHEDPTALPIGALRLILGERRRHVAILGEEDEIRVGVCAILRVAGDGVVVLLELGFLPVRRHARMLVGAHLRLDRHADPRVALMREDIDMLAQRLRFGAIAIIRNILFPNGDRIRGAKLRIGESSHRTKHVIAKSVVGGRVEEPSQHLRKANLIPFLAVFENRPEIRRMRDSELRAHAGCDTQRLELLDQRIHVLLHIIVYHGSHLILICILYSLD